MSQISLYHLKALVEVARHGSFSRTAVVTGAAQPTISRQISELEAHWQGKLFYRTGRGVELSDLGHKALSRAEAILRDIDHLTDDMRSEQGMPSGEVTIATVPSLVSTLLPPLVKELRAERPAIRIRILEGFSEQVIRWNSEGAADVGLYARYFGESRADSGRGHLSRILLVTPNPDFRDQEEINFSDLANYELVLPMQPNALRNCIDAIARQRGINLNIAAEAVSFMAQREIAAYCGYSFLADKSFPTLNQLGENFHSITIRDPYLLRKIVLSTNQGGPLTRAASEVTKRLERLFEHQQVDYETV